MHATNPLLCNRTVPDMVEVVVAPIPFDVDAVASSLHVLVVQRLMQIADEVNNKLGSLHSLPGRDVMR